MYKGDIQKLIKKYKAVKCPQTSIEDIVFETYQISVSSSFVIEISVEHDLEELDNVTFYLLVGIFRRKLSIKGSGCIDSLLGIMS